MSQQGDNWSSMMSDDIEIATQSNGNQHSAPKRKPTRTANYSPEEDLQLCRSWENISLDPVTRNGQPNKAYWKRIHDNFHANKTFASNRNANSLEHRWGVIHKECQKFQDLFEEAERYHSSGLSYPEYLFEARKAYANNDPKRKGFPFLHCWLKIRHSQKFKCPTTNKRPRGSNSSPIIDVFDLEDGENRKSQTPDSSMPNGKRHIERKQAREKIKKGEQQTKYAVLLEKLLIEKEKIRKDRLQENKMMQERKESLEARKISLEDRKMSLEERKVANEEKKLLWEQEQKIMFCNLDTLDPSQKTYVIAMRALIAAKKMAASNSEGHEASGGRNGSDRIW